MLLRVEIPAEREGEEERQGGGGGEIEYVKCIYMCFHLTQIFVISITYTFLLNKLVHV